MEYALKAGTWGLDLLMIAKHHEIRIIERVRYVHRAHSPPPPPPRGGTTGAEAPLNLASKTLQIAACRSHANQDHCLEDSDASNVRQPLIVNHQLSNYSRSR